MEREQARLATDLRGQEGQHLMNPQGESNVRRLRGRNVPIPIPPTLREGLRADLPPGGTPALQPPDKTLAAEPPVPPPLLHSSTSVPPVTPPNTSATKRPPSLTNPMTKPNLPPKPVTSRTRSNPRSEMPQGVSSEMESDDYHGVSKLLTERAAKINKGKLALDLQDRDRTPSYVSDSEDDTSSHTLKARPYDDGEVSLRAVASSSSDATSIRSKSPSSEVYLTPTQTRNNTRQEVDHHHAQGKRYIEEKINRWSGAGTHIDGRYYSYRNHDVKNMKPLTDAIIYHPPARKFVRIRGDELSIVAKMPISLDQLIVFERFECYTCYDPVSTEATTDDLTWDSFQLMHPEGDPGYETPDYMSVSNLQSNVTPTPRLDHAEVKVNSFGNSVDLGSYERQQPKEESVVERLLDDKSQIQSQLRDISSESNEDEQNLPRTLGQHQMQFLTHFQSIRNVQEQQSRSTEKTSGQTNQGAYVQRTPTQPPPSFPNQYSPDEVEVTREELASRHQVSRLKEIMETNLRVLQDQIDWNHEKIREGERVRELKEQGTSMTPRKRDEKSTNTSGLDVNSLKPPLEQNYCTNCGEYLRNCRCRNWQAIRERETNWLQEALLESYNTQKRRTHRDVHGVLDPREPDHQRLDAIAMARKIANPSGRNWDSKGKLDGQFARQLQDKGDQGTTPINDRSGQYNVKMNTSNMPNVNSHQDNGMSRPLGEPREENTPADKRTLNPPLYHNTSGQTSNFHNAMIKGNRPLTEGEQLLSNRDLRSESTSHTNPPGVNYPSNSHKTIYHQSHDSMTPNSQITKQLFTENKEDITGINDNKRKNVQFLDERETQYNNHKQEGYNPILITPRPPHMNSTWESAEMEHSDGTNRPQFNLYFSGTVENGRGGDFHGYYFYPNHPTVEILKPERTSNGRLTSTPYLANDQVQPNTPKGMGSVGYRPPRRLFPPRVEEGTFQNKLDRDPHESTLYYREGPPNYERELTAPPQHTYNEDGEGKRPISYRNPTAHYNHPRYNDTRSKHVDQGYSEYSRTRGNVGDREYTHQNRPGRNYFKQEDDDGYPLPEFEGKNPMEPQERMGGTAAAARDRDPGLTDSDGEAGNEVTGPKNISFAHGNMSGSLNTSQNDVLSQLLQHQKNLQDKNLQIMENLVNKSTNSFVLEDVPVFDGLRGSVDFDTWLLELDKATEITGLSMIELAFSKSSGTPHKMIKRLRREKSWEFIKEKLQITYAKLATEVHASTDLNQNKQKRHEPLEDYIERFYQNYRRATGDDPARTRNLHVINTFIRNLYNKDIRKRVSNAPSSDLQTAFNSAIKIQRKLKRFEGYEYESDDDDDNKTVNIIDLNKDGMTTAKGVIPGITGAAGIGPCFKCGEYGHLSRNCPTRDNLKTSPRAPTYVKSTTGQYIPLQLLDSNPPTLTQQITTQGIITPNAWAEIQEKVNTLAENNQLIDKKQKSLGRTQEKLKRLTKTIQKPTGRSTYRSVSPAPRSKTVKKNQSDHKSSNDKKDKKKVTFNKQVSPGKSQDSHKQVNLVRKDEQMTSDSEGDDTSETNIPDDTSVSSEERDRTAYFDIFSSSSDDAAEDSENDE